MLLLLLYTAWARSGVYAPWHGPLWVLTGALLLVSTAAVIQASPERRRRILRDPLVYIWILLTLLLLLQWLNTGGVLYVNLFTGDYAYTAPRWRGWPFSIDAPLSCQQLAWFIPAGLLLFDLRHLLSRASIKWLLHALLLNAALLALFGLLQIALGWTRMFDLIDIPGNPHLLATFDYPNHAGTFFYLFFALSIGLLIDALEKHKSLFHRIIPALLTLLFGITAMASLSRFAVLAVLGLALVGLGVWTLLQHRRFSVGSWINLVLFSGVIGILLVIGLLNIGNGAVLRELTEETAPDEGLAATYQENRGFQIPPALEMVKDYPWFGVGGWGYRRYLRVYLSDAEYQHYLSTGRANVHCDPVQFLAEHGIVGAGLMTAGLAVLLWPWWKLRRWRFRGLPWMMLAGTGAVMVHSLIDLPFRCPAVLWHVLLLLAAMPVLAEGYASQARSRGEAEAVSAATGEDLNLMKRLAPDTA